MYRIELSNGEDGSSVGAVFGFAAGGPAARWKQRMAISGAECGIEIQRYHDCHS